MQLDVNAEVAVQGISRLAIEKRRSFARAAVILFHKLVQR